MKIDYSKGKPDAVQRVRELPTVSATALKNSIADVFDQVGAMGAVAITRHDKPRAVLLSVEEYEGLKAAFDEPLLKVREEYDAMLERMQTPEAREGAERAFHATPDELGRAAVEAARQEAEGKAAE